VAVIYADWRDADAPEPDQVLDAAVANGCRALLIDTWRKDGGNVFAHCKAPEIDALFHRAKGCGLLTVLAGSLGLDNVEAALSLSPNYLAVRGAVCNGPREGELCLHKLRQWCELVHQTAGDMLWTAEEVDRLRAEAVSMLDHHGMMHDAHAITTGQKRRA
jgi:uncharacterized protein (UPF0264 family)